MNKSRNKEHNNKSKTPMQSKIIEIISIIISLCALGVSIFSCFSDQESMPLSYYLKPTITSFEDNIANVEIEAIVTNGAIGDVRVIDYRDGEIIDIANNLEGTISKTSNKSQCKFTFELGILSDNQENEFFATNYMLIHGKDGSISLGMILYHINLTSKEISPKYYSFEDLAIGELDPNQEVYSNAFNNYRELTKTLREKGVL